MKSNKNNILSAFPSSRVDQPISRAYDSKIPMNEEKL